MGVAIEAMRIHVCCPTLSVVDYKVAGKSYIDQVNFTRYIESASMIAFTTILLSGNGT